LSAMRSLVALLIGGRFGLRGRVEGVKLALRLISSVSALERPVAASPGSPSAELGFDAQTSAT
jgi:hypothetical protein